MKVSQFLRNAAAGRELPLVTSSESVGLSPWLLGAGFGIALFAFMISPALLVELPPIVRLDLLGTALFFGTSFGIVIGSLGPVLRGARQDLLELRPVLPLSDEDFDVVQRAVTRMSSPTLLLTMCAGALLGLTHNLLLAHFSLPMPFRITNSVGTLLLWLVMNRMSFSSI